MLKRFATLIVVKQLQAFRGEKATSIYRPSKKAATEYTEDELEALKASDKFHRPDKGFSGTESSGQLKMRRCVGLLCSCLYRTRVAATGKKDKKKRLFSLSS